METLKTWIIFLTFIAITVLLLLKGCNNPYAHLNVEPQQQIIYKTDTIYTKDTLIKLKTIYKPKYDTIYKIDTLVYKESLDSLLYVRIYKDSLKDSNQTIYSKVKVLGKLEQLDLSYKLNPRPIIINSIKTIETIYKKPKCSMYIGGTVGGNASSFYFSPTITLGFDKTNITYSYEVVNKAHMLGISIELFNIKN